MQHIRSTFEYLEEWMRSGSHWTGVVHKETYAKPNLYLPANIIALFVLSYPDLKYRNFVGRLQINWLMRDQTGRPRPRRLLRRLTNQDLATVFQCNEPFSLKVPLLVEYNCLWGRDFLQPQKDIRPQLPVCTAHLPL